MKPWYQVVGRYKAWAITLVIALPALALIYQYAWYQVPFSRITYNGRAVQKASVYRYHDDTILVRLANVAPNELYLIDCKTATISIPDSFSFVYLPGMAISKHVPVESSDMRDAKIGIDPNTKILRNGFVITNEYKDRVTVTIK